MGHCGAGITAALLVVVAVGIGMKRSERSENRASEGRTAETTARSMNIGSIDSPRLKPSQGPRKSGRRADPEKYRAALMNRAACIMNIRNVQQAMRSFQNMNGFGPGEDGYQKTALFGPKSFLESPPTCPSGGTYSWVEGKFPLVGELALRCSHTGHVPERHEDW